MVINTTQLAREAKVFRFSNRNFSYLRVFFLFFFLHFNLLSHFVDDVEILHSKVIRGQPQTHNLSRFSLHQKRAINDLTCAQTKLPAV